MEGPKGFWSNYMILSQSLGILKKVWIDEEYKNNNIVKYEIMFKQGDEIEAFTGSNGTLGTMILKFESENEMLEKMDHMEKWIKVIVE